ncbi:secretin receptor-like [Mercenaria mercenaria]|uniref:secretin receptor-like n=1 Tax=Mercenaria mercenaria TaxID=6596 RepID=UPI00234F3FDA|nr:secretin receptor-like [Mercenaria mercenaria]XP_053374705.1 secretin receptor-like [Mercenaria mercenaria]XP_053374706.1 secretin receptor-like [Mercenaria mercenaria]XP_053374707.1 secretin receptor-like [Mercenaria mercenaria]XP_053374708.1 secretin receptor-like [Mercenaria mercenaria]
MMAIRKKMQHLCEARMLQDPPGTGVYCNATWDYVMCWNFTQAGTMVKQPCAEYIGNFNLAGFATRECLPNGTWKSNYEETNSTDGWTNYTDCLVGHKPEPSKDLFHHLPRIQLMSEIGYGVSLVSLIAAVTIMIASKRLRCKSNVLHINLFLAFIIRASVSFFKTLIFVDDVGLEKDIIRNPGGTIEFRPEGLHWECKLIMCIFVYTVAASMMWILMEGLYLHMLVYKTMFTKQHGTRLYILVGWLSPLVYLIPWIIVRIFKENELCWNRQRKDGYFWIIKAPIHLSVLINFIFFINIIRVLCVKSKISRHVKSDAQHLRKTAKFVLVLIPLFGVIYIAFSAYPTGVVSMEADIIYLYCEMFYNSFQGFVLALLFCFLNEEVQNEVRRCWCKRRFRRFNTHSILLSSWRKSSRRTSRDITRDTRLSEGICHTHGNCVDTCKLKKKCQEHVTFSLQSHEMTNGKPNVPSRQNEDIDCIMIEPKRSKLKDDEV